MYTTAPTLRSVERYFLRKWKMTEDLDVELVVRQAAGKLLGTVRLLRTEMFHGSCGEALRRAEEESAQAGLGGYYAITGIEELGPIRLDAPHGNVLAEIQRQLASLQPKSGFRWGFNSPPFSPEELAAIPSAQSQISRLIDLRDKLTKRIQDAALQGEEQP